MRGESSWGFVYFYQMIILNMFGACGLAFVGREREREKEIGLLRCSL